MKEKKIKEPKDEMIKFRVNSEKKKKLPKAVRRNGFKSISNYLNECVDNIIEDNL